MGEEVAQFGWDALACMLGKSKRTCMRSRAELKAAGAISSRKGRECLKIL